LSNQPLRSYIKNCSLRENGNEGIEADYSSINAVNCNFSGNQDGVDLGVALFKGHYCSYIDNFYNGLHADDGSTVNVSYCWWGNASGPYHWFKNPGGTGDAVSDHVEFEPWQTALFQPDALISNFRCSLNALDWRVVYPDENTPKPLGCVAASVSDWLASAFVTTKLPEYVEGLDTDPSYVDQGTGEPVGDPGSGIITFGGPFVNPIVKRAEDSATAPEDRAQVKFYNGGDTFYFHYKNGTSIPGAELPLSVINNDEDLFLIETFRDGDSRVIIICYGFGWKGTYAAGKFIDTIVIPNIESYMHGWIITHWQDSNGDGFVNDPGEGDTYTRIATGN
jgi:hypothetical protein